jgi:hypothetical protein
MPYGNTARDEDSVVVALQGLMGLEDERQREEVRQRRRAEAEERRRREERERMLAFQLEMKRISGKSRGIPAWTIGAAAMVFLVLLGVGIAFHLSRASSYQQRIADLQANLGQIENKSAAELGAAHAELGQVTERAASAERLVNELRGKVASLEDKVEQLETARPGKRPRPIRAGARPGKSVEQGQTAAGGLQLSDDPLDDKLKLD